MKKKIFISGVVMTGLLAVGSLGVFPVGAQEKVSYPPIVQKLAERFGLNEEEVGEVFEEERAAHHAEMLTHFEDRLSESVENGKITEEQKQAILEKHEEMRAKMDALMQDENLTHEEKRQQMRAIHEEVRSWAEEEGIETPFLTFKFGGHGDRMKFIKGLN